MPTVALSTRDDVSSEMEQIRTFIERWKTCWENNKLEEYIKCYSDDFMIKGIDKQGWKKFKRSLSKKYKNIKVTFKNTEIDIKEGGKKAEVSLLQYYRSDQYSDEGLKTLILKKEKRKWRIVRENWKPL